MLITPTIDKLHALALSGMARALTDQQGHPDYASLSFEERLGLLVDREVQDRENRRLARHLKNARLRSDAVIEDVDLRTPRGLDRAAVLALGEATWVRDHRNVLITGPTGVGKTVCGERAGAADTGEAPETGVAPGVPLATEPRGRWRPAWSAYRGSTRSWRATSGGPARTRSRPAAAGAAAPGPSSGGAVTGAGSGPRRGSIASRCVASAAGPAATPPACCPPSRCRAIAMPGR